ncbi:sigma-70 family RNA polymerase sigma factor [Haloferula sp. BvORR071]|uniref:RNA polymerase sigma factor n=1 Tax=Haloferula sp. BvORR071 TaxID=1396141 RepID=UPI0022410303|nr:sigma-70 family RNA polymerase sigma factor [Haloferula sp. BvORR071]
MADNPFELLQRFNRDRSEAAFRELVRQHSPLVFATALRRLNGDRSAAQDVMQEVFTLLVRKSSGLDPAQLSAWLYRQTCRRAANHVRSESRRRQRELVSMEAMNHPPTPDESDRELLARELDSAMLSLPSSDRSALVMRYFEDRDFRSVAGTLGLSEVAARKRVSRALEKLAAVLKRRGITTGSALLGSTMSSMGRSIPPDSMVAKVSLQAMKSLPAAGSPSLSGLMKPALAGVALVSLISAGLLAKSRPTPVPPVPMASTPTSARESGLAYLLRPVTDTSIENLIAEIKRNQAGPGHSLVTLRLRAILDRVAIADIPAFVVLAGEKLTVAEQTACYAPLFERWLDQDPAAALSYVLLNKPGEKVDAETSTYMLGNLFRAWVEKDLKQADAWLREHWGDEGFKEHRWNGSVGEGFAMEVANDYVLRGNVSDAFEFIRALPNADARRRCLRGLAGEDPYGNAWHNIDPDRLLEVLRALSGFPETEPAGEARVLLWQSLNRSRPEDAAKVLAALSPQEHFEAALAKTGHYSKLASRTKTAGGGTISHFDQITDTTAGEADAMAAGLAAGLSRQEILKAIGAALVSKGNPAVAVPWLAGHREEVEVDAVLLGAIRDAARREDHSNLILWAACLRDPDLRMSIARAGFRQILAQPGDTAKNLLADPSLDAGLREELVEIRDAKP